MKPLAWIDRASVAWLTLLLPLVALEIWLISTIGGYGWDRFAEDVIFAIAFSGLLVLFARWRVLGFASGAAAWFAYAMVLSLVVGEAVSFYFQGSGFNDRFFANLRLTNLRSTLDAFPALSLTCLVGLAGMLILSGWLLARQTALRVRDDFLHGVFKAAALLIVAAAAVFLPSSPRRLSSYFAMYFRSGRLVSSSRGRYAAKHINADPTSRGELIARAGKNLVIIYMESLERIYTDNSIFPGLTPALNRYRSRSLDFAGYLTFPGATYTMAGLFSSQCGAPYFNSPWEAYWHTNNDNSDISFQPELVCLGDVLHEAGYRQVFMNGSPLSFADQGEFFKLHGYDREFGLDELESAGKHRLPESGWGLYDSELFALAADKFHALSSSGNPFNLSLLTIDNHPPHGRPSPGCPRYQANAATTFQSVHCTDFLVGHFLDAISKDTAWKNTVVVIMSDHQSMPNDAWPSYPKSYVRRPLLFILNAGRGVRSQRVYHMDIAPTVLALMGVRTNATFMAGADRSAANSPDSPLRDDPATVAVLRQVVWGRSAPIELCRNDILLAYDQGDGFRIGNRSVPISRQGVRSIGIDAGQSLEMLIGSRDVKAFVLPFGGIAKAMALRGDSSAMLFTPLPDAHGSTGLSLDWLGRHGALAHLADLPRLSGLRVELPNCAGTLDRLDGRGGRTNVDLAGETAVRTAPLYPQLPDLPAKVNFGTTEASAVERDVGWHHWQEHGSWASGDAAAIGFRLPRRNCHTAEAEFHAHPFLPPSRPRLDVQVLVDGRQAALWQIGGESMGSRILDVPIATADAQCRVDMLFRFTRPDAFPPPYPAGEDPRPLQMEFVDMRIGSPTARSNPAAAARGAARKTGGPGRRGYVG